MKSRPRRRPERPRDASAARDTALGLLARREHGRAELARKLRERDFPADVAETVLDALAAEGLQSDARYAEEYARARVNRGYGPVAVRAELGARGVADSHISQALEAVDTPWRELAARARAGRFGDAPPEDRAERARQARFLERRGFAWEHIRAALPGL